MEAFALKKALDNVRATTPLVHNITNYVTVNDCANALLAIGASPIMSDEPADVEDIQTICGGLVLNIGTLNERTIAGMFAAGGARRSARASHRARSGGGPAPRLCARRQLATCWTSWI